ncbi:MAG: acetyl/propionyl/methylcrotonyl-CoA carboxylase subunit alpha [Wenzhouxiangellaceae bacterium]
MKNTPKTLFNRVLIANRGEIACRVMRSCQRLGIGTVAVYSDADARAMHVRMADQAIRLGPASAAESYLHIDKVIGAARLAGAEAIHPGYGFLSENPAFAAAVDQAGLILIGPSADTMRQMGSKAAAKQTMRAAGVPVVPGYEGDDQDLATLQREADQIGYPLLIKAAAGGGGKGMRIVRRAAEFAEQLGSAQREASSAFGDARMILERYLERPSHIEVQVFGDQHGNVVHLFERDCSSQRRYQKIIEEAPAGKLSAALQSAMHEAAVQAARSVDYRGAGTVEFIVSGDDFYFMEMNTRLQVEHPVTEMITGIDLVEWQLRVAAGEPLPLPQEQIRQSGHAMEARIYAEDPEHGFLPSAGTLQRLQFPPQSAAVRVDTGVREGDQVSIHYDPMIAKLIVHAASRQAALQQLQQALAASCIAGLKHNLGFLQTLAAAEIFTTADPARRIHTAWLDGHLDELLATRPSEPPQELIALAAMLLLHTTATPQQTSDPWSPWALRDGWRIGAAAARSIKLACGQQQYRVSSRALTADLDGDTEITLDDAEVMTVSGFWHSTANTADAMPAYQAAMLVAGRMLRATVHCLPDAIELVHGSMRWRFARVNELRSDDAAASSQDRILAPMPGRILAVNHKAGEQAAAGAVVVVMEAMKMEISLRAEADVVIKAVHVAADDTVSADACLIEFESEA